MKNIILVDHKEPTTAIAVKCDVDDSEINIMHFKDVGLQRIYSANMIAVEDANGKLILVKNRYAMSAHEDKIRFNTIDGMIAYMNAFLIDAALPTINKVVVEQKQYFNLEVRGL